MSETAVTNIQELNDRTPPAGGGQCCGFSDQPHTKSEQDFAPSDNFMINKSFSDFCLLFIYHDYFNYLTTVQDDLTG